jgi:hypothetical protein
MTGGSKKGVYRLAFDDGSSVVGYLWNEEENYWPAVSRPPGYDPRTDPFSDASGAGLFEACRAEGFGKVGFTGQARGGSCEQVVFDRLVDGSRQPVLADIEGLMFFDIEWEHAFLELRFKNHYRRLRRDDLDQRRLRLYRLALSLSLTAGPLRLVDSDFPEREFMIEIAEYNADRTLGYV